MMVLKWVVFVPFIDTNKESQRATDLLRFRVAHFILDKTIKLDTGFILDSTKSFFNIATPEKA